MKLSVLVLESVVKEVYPEAEMSSDFDITVIDGVILVKGTGCRDGSHVSDIRGDNLHWTEGPAAVSCTKEHLKISSSTTASRFIIKVENVALCSGRFGTAGKKDLTSVLSKIHSVISTAAFQSIQ